MREYDSSKSFKHMIKAMIKETWADSSFMTVSEGRLYTYFKTSHRGKEIDHTDGIGSKGHLHWLQGTFHEAVLDVLAMNINDLAMVGCIPYKTQIHLNMPKENNEILFAVMRHMVDECKKRKIVITGGETSINNLSSFDISMSMSGVVAYPKDDWVAPGATLIGIKSNGAHSNGFTLLRKIFELGDARLTLPTKDYSKIAPLSYPSMHITGGAYTKLKDILPKNCNMHIHLPDNIEHKSLWEDIARNVNNDNASHYFSTLNWGIGMVVAATSPLPTLKDSLVIGSVIEGGTGQVFVQPPSFVKCDKVVL